MSVPCWVFPIGYSLSGTASKSLKCLKVLPGPSMFPIGCSLLALFPKFRLLGRQTLKLRHMGQLLVMAQGP